jgi:hypothetical protein
VLVWNERKLEATPFLREYEALVQSFGTDYNAVRHENVSNEAIAAFFAPDTFVTREFPNAQHFDYEGLEARLLSSSYTPPEGDPKRGPMLDELREMFDRNQQGGRVTFEYDTRAYVGRLTGV